MPFSPFRVALPGSKTCLDKGVFLTPPVHTYCTYRYNCVAGRAIPALPVRITAHALVRRAFVLKTTLHGGSISIHSSRHGHSPFDLSVMSHKPHYQ